MGSAPGLPAGWEWKTLGDIATVVGGSTPKIKGAELLEGGDPVAWSLRSSPVTTRMFISSGSPIDHAGWVDSRATQLLPAWNRLFSSRAPIGYVAIAANELCTSQGFKSFVPSEGGPERVPLLVVVACQAHRRIHGERHNLQGDIWQARTPRFRFLCRR